MFNSDSWIRDMRAAFAAHDAEWLAELMYENDHNGVFSYEMVCAEFGEMSREDWAASTLVCAKRVIEDHPNHC